MEQAPNTKLIFDLFESSGIGLVGFDADNRIAQVNRNVGVYLDLESEQLLGREAAALRPGIRSEEFWAAFPGTFYCLAPAPQCLLLIVSRRLGPEHGSTLRRALIMRPYSLEREFGRMRVFLNNYLAHEVAARLSSVGIASEFITEPELRESVQTREAFLSTFRHDVADLNSLFVQLLETAEQLAMPNRVLHTPVDWKALSEDLVAKISGLASERSIALVANLPTHLPPPAGDYHWLYLGLFGVVSHALRTAQALTEVTIDVRLGGNRMETVVSARPVDSEHEALRPDPVLFPLEDNNPRIGRLEISDLAVTRSIFLLHAGDLRVERAGERVAYTISLPV